MPASRPTTKVRTRRTSWRNCVPGAPATGLSVNTSITRVVEGALTSASGFNELFEDASRRKFDIVLFWALDRFSREGMVPTINYLQRLDSYGVAFHSYTESHLATDNELVRNILLAVMSSLAKVEAEKIRERVKAGLQRAVAKGKKLGRKCWS
jgi:DNA invertase Pin-like site-specific DNA recombinase